ncbi:MAG: response regulator [Leptolyngbyaceae cyanobacterium]
MANILLIGNDQSSYSELHQQLHLYGYNLLISTEGGDQGILRAINESPDLVIVDSDLAIIDGWRVIKILKASTVTQATPIIVSISPTIQADWQKLSQSACDDYCLKPVTSMHLLGKIHRLLERTSDAGPVEPIRQSSLSQNTVFKEKQDSPISRPTSFNENRGDSLASSPEKPLVIYIEDNQSDSVAMETIVQNVGYGYANIIDPLQALPQLLELRPKLIFLDLVMPLVNGYELCAQIRRMSMFKEVPVIIVTNNDGIADRVRAKVVGASGFLGKPIRQKRVEKVLSKYLQPVSKVTPDDAKQPNFIPLF